MDCLVNGNNSVGLFLMNGKGSGCKFARESVELSVQVKIQEGL